MPSRADIVVAAESWIGTPYRHQASLRGVGADCLGLVRGVWRDVFGEEPESVPPYVADWAESDGSETLAEAARRHLDEVPVKEMRAGDVLLFRMRANGPAKHAAIHAGRESMIHAHSGLHVSRVSIDRAWLRRLAFVFRFPGLTD